MFAGKPCLRDGRGYAGAGWSVLIHRTQKPFRGHARPSQMLGIVTKVINRPGTLARRRVDGREGRLADLDW